MLRLLYLLFSLLSISAFSQYKFEKEYRIDSKETPVKAMEFIKKCNFPKKIKWYAEESQLGKSFEAKTYYKKRKYSIEFDELGTLIDAEIKVKFSELPMDVQSNINKTLSNLFDKYKIEKVQIQHSGSESAIYKSMFHLKTKHQKANLNYELVVKGKKLNSYLKYEFLFNKEGIVVDELQFAPENFDNLEF